MENLGSRSELMLARLKTQGVGWTKSTPIIIAVRSTNELNTEY